jgi:hypothetical protein
MLIGHFIALSDIGLGFIELVFIMLGGGRIFGVLVGVWEGIVREELERLRLGVNWGLLLVLSIIRIYRLVTVMCWCFG